MVYLIFGTTGSELVIFIGYLSSHPSSNTLCKGKLRYSSLFDRDTTFLELITELTKKEGKYIMDFEF